MRILWAALALTWAGSAAVKTSLTCVRKSGGHYKEPPTLSALVACQHDKLADAAADYKAKNDLDPPDSVMDNWQGAQRDEVRAYLNRHPDRASLDSPAAPAGKEQAGAAQPGSDPGVDALAKKVQAESNGGKDGVTPEMSQQMHDYLMQRQGSVSPDMQQLLNDVQKDGPNLSADTVSKLQNAAQQAHGQGLDLNTDQQTQDFLLKSDKPDPNPNQN